MDAEQVTDPIHPGRGLYLSWVLLDWELDLRVIQVRAVLSKAHFVLRVLADKQHRRHGAAREIRTFVRVQPGARTYH